MVVVGIATPGPAALVGGPSETGRGAGVLDVCKAALVTFEAIGCIVEEAQPDYPVDAVWQAFVKLRAWQTGGTLLPFYRDPAKRALMKPEAVWEVESGQKLSAYDITAASAMRSEWYHAVRRFFESSST